MIDKTLDYLEFSVSPLSMRLQKLAFQMLLMKQENSSSTPQKEQVLALSIQMEQSAYQDIVLQNMEDRLSSLNQVQQKEKFFIPWELEQLKKRPYLEIFEGVQRYHEANGGRKHEIELSCLKSQELYIAGPALSIADIYFYNLVVNFEAMIKLLSQAESG